MHVHEEDEERKTQLKRVRHVAASSHANVASAGWLFRRLAAASAETRKNTRNDDLAAERYMVGVSGRALANKTLCLPKSPDSGASARGRPSSGHAHSTVTSNCQFSVQRQTHDATNTKKCSEIETHRKTVSFSTTNNTIWHNERINH